MPKSGRQISMHSEVLRKLIHLSSIWIPLSYHFLPRSTVLWILLPLTAISLFFDYGRYFSPAINQFVQTLFGPILRSHEQDNSRKLLSGATYILISAVLCILIFPRIIAVSAFAILIVADSASALFGRRFGKHRVFDKSIEGAIAFAIAGFIVILLTPKVYGHWLEFVLGGIAACIGAVVEMSSTKLRLDDNLSVPAAIGLTLWGGYVILAKLSPSFVDVLYRLSL